MNTTDSTAAGGPRRLRMATMDEQNEFMRVARALRDAGMPDEELQRHLGYDDMETFQGALRSGRVTEQRLERLRALAKDRMAEAAEQRAANSDARMEHLFERLRDDVTASGRAPVEEPRAARAESAPPTAKRKRAPARGRKRVFLTTKQHERLREQVEHLFAVDKRFRNWSLLARVMGLSTGQAAKRAYDVNSSLTTLQNVETFARLHAGFGSKATAALKSGVAIDKLQTHLMGGAKGAAEGVDAGDDGAGAEAEAPRESAVERTSALSSLPDVPPSVDFETMMELGTALDIEVKRLFHQARFFDGLSRLTTLPNTIRWNAAQTRDRLQDALRFFGGDFAGQHGEQADGTAAGNADAAGETSPPQPGS